MTGTELVDLQEALVYVFAPWVQLFIALMVGGSIITAVLMMFVKMARWLTQSG